MRNQIESLLNMEDQLTKLDWMRWDKGDCSEIGLCEILLAQLIRNHKNENGQNYNTEFDEIRLRYYNNDNQNSLNKVTLQDIVDNYPDCILLDGFNNAILGIGERINLGPVVAYSVEKIINTLMSRDKMSYEDAYEYYNFNIVGAWMGDNTPVFITTEA